MDVGRHIGLVELGHGGGDQLPVGQQPELLEQLVEILGHSFERVVELLEWDELVLNHLQVFQERLDRGEHFAGQVPQVQSRLFPARSAVSRRSSRTSKVS
jgi:hypothetical protein